MKFEEIMQQWHNHRRGDPGGRAYGLFHRRMYSFNLIIGAGLDQSRPYILSGFA